MKKIRLNTPFEVSAVPLSEYPRPQFARDSYITLNGEWEYAIYKKDTPFKGYQGKILVPFSPECLLSGLPEGVKVTPSDTLFYKRGFFLPQGFLKARTFINFDAVDYECEVIINGKAAGSHCGGYTAFSIDATDFVKQGENTIEVLVNDPGDTSYHARGKQANKRGGIWYTPQSGIWQSVWLESVGESYIKDFTLTPDIDAGVLNVEIEAENAKTADFVILDGDTVVKAEKFTLPRTRVKLDGFELWSPENPKLYDIVLKVGDDIVKSYFGMRKFSIVKDENGISRLGLNNKPYFHTGVLDQGYWSDGMLTPPSNAALEYDVKLVKTMGFNMIRKHIKIESLRWYYHCDKEGVLVWQDMVSGGTKYNFWAIGALPFVGVHVKDDRYKFFARAEQASRDEYIKDMKDTVSRLKNCVSLALWVPFNEGWGQFDSVKITKMLRELDDTRIIDSVSGWHDQGKDSSDLKSLHIYFRPVSLPRKEKRCVVLSEFGGYSIPTKGHMFSPDKIFGYKVFKNTEQLANAYKKLYEKEIIPKIKEGLSATVYTQVSDVEEEINGLVTYDRKVVKLPIDTVKSINKKLKI
jgi:hypothetical protein